MKNVKLITLAIFLLCSFIIEAQSKEGYVRYKTYTEAQRDNIATPDTSLRYVLYNLTSEQWETYNHITNEWEALFSDSGSTGGHIISDNGVVLPTRERLNFTNFNITDNIATNSTDISVNVGIPVTYNYTTTGGETSVTVSTDIATNYSKEVYYGNTILIPNKDYTITYPRTINFTFPLQEDYNVRVVYNDLDSPNAFALTTTGTGAATYDGSTLNIPESSGGGDSPTAPVENTYSTISAMYSDQGNQTASFLQFVADASAHSGVTNGKAYFEYLGTTTGSETDYRLVIDEDLGYVTTGTTQTITGTKTFSTGTKSYNIETKADGVRTALVVNKTGNGGAGISLINTGNADGIKVQNDGTGEGIFVYNNGTGKGIEANTSGAGVAIRANTDGTSAAIDVHTQLSSGNGVVSSIGSTATGYAYVGRNGGTNTFTVDKLGNVVGSTFNGVPLTDTGSATKYLNEQGDYVTVSGGTGGIPEAPTDGGSYVRYNSTWSEITAPILKGMYESNANTNAFTDAEKTKLSNAPSLVAVNTFTNTGNTFSQGLRVVGSIGSDVFKVTNNSSSSSAIVADAGMVASGNNFEGRREGVLNFKVNYTGDVTAQSYNNVALDATGSSNKFLNQAGTYTDARPYKVYTALLTQTTTNAPTAHVLENTLGGTVIWTRTDTGQYSATLAGAFTQNKTWCSGNKGNTAGYMLTYRFDNDTVKLISRDESTGTWQDGLSLTSIEIRVYN